MIDKELTNSVLALLRTAGEGILSVYSKDDPGLRWKEDDSPVTEADFLSDSIIKNGLAALTPEIPVFSEEADDTGYMVRKNWHTYWVLDPLDGTKEFITGNDEFCICLALISGKRPEAGFIHVPVANETYYAHRAKGAYAVKREAAHRLPLEFPEGPVRISVSRSHHSSREEEMIEKVSAIYPVEMEMHGSAIKFCKVAEGSVDIYPRFRRSNEWDVAAGDILVTEAGGAFIEIPGGAHPHYNRPDHSLNTFIACGPRGKKILEKELRHLLA